MLTAAVEPSPGERREIVILVPFVVSQKEARTEEHFIKNTTSIHRAAGGRCGKVATRRFQSLHSYFCWFF